MKRIITSIAYLFISTISFAQLNAAFEKDTISFERDKQTDKIFHLVVNISNINAAGIAANTITFVINPSPASTMAIIDYQLNVAPINVYGDTSDRLPYNNFSW